MEAREAEKDNGKKKKKVQKIVNLNSEPEEMPSNSQADEKKCEKPKKSRKTKKVRDPTDCKVTVNSQSESSQIGASFEVCQNELTKKSEKLKQPKQSKQSIQRKVVKKKQQEVICGLCFDLFPQAEIKKHKQECPAILKYCFDCSQSYPSSIFEMHRQVCDAALKNKQKMQKELQDKKARAEALRRLFEVPSGSPQSQRRVNAPGQFGPSMPLPGMFRSQMDVNSFPPIGMMNPMLPMGGIPAISRFAGYLPTVPRMPYTMPQAMIPPLPLTEQQPLKKTEPEITKQRITKIEKLHQVCYIPQDFESEDCSICCVRFLLMQQLLELKCKHVYHVSCIVSWLKRNDKCPLCNATAL